MSTTTSDIVNVIIVAVLTYLFDNVFKTSYKRKLIKDNLFSKLSNLYYINFKLVYYNWLAIYAINLLMGVLFIFWGLYDIDKLFNYLLISIFLCIQIFVSFTNRKYKVIHCLLNENLLNHRLKNNLIFYIPNISLTIISIIMFIMDITILKALIIAILGFIPIFCALNYYSASVKCNKYSHVKIYFNNSFPVQEIKIENFKQGENFTSVKLKNKEIVHSNHTIVKIEYLREKANAKHKRLLKKHGFKK